MLQRFRHARHHDEALDLALLVGGQEARIVLEGHAAMGFRTAAAQQVGVGEQAVAAILVAAAGWGETYRLDTVERDSRSFKS